MICTYLASSSYSFIISTLFADKNLCVTLTPILIIPLMLFGGYFAPISSFEKIFQYISYVSFFRYGWQALIQVTYNFASHFSDYSLL